MTGGRETAREPMELAQIRIYKGEVCHHGCQAGLIGVPRPEHAFRINLSGGNRIGQLSVKVCRLATFDRTQRQAVYPKRMRLAACLGRQNLQQSVLGSDFFKLEWR